MTVKSSGEGDGRTGFASGIVVERDGCRFSGRMNKSADSRRPGRGPLVIAIHGGSYSSAYFDVPGYSLLLAGDRSDVPVIALDRPSYGLSTPLAPEDSTIARNAEVLVQAVAGIWETRKTSHAGVFLIGHSIGAATAVTMAARKPSWPLIGIAISGVGLSVAPGDDVRWAALPAGLVTLPAEIKDFVMFGPPGTYGADMPAASHVANTTCPRAELIDITTTWPRVVREVTAEVEVPVHYRQAEFDRLWVASREQVDAFAKAFSKSPRVDSRLFADAGHCIDFHSPAAVFHEEQLTFALDCAARASER